MVRMWLTLFELIRLHNVKTHLHFLTTPSKKLITRFDETGSVMDRPISGWPSILQDRMEDVNLTLRLQQTDNPLGATSIAIHDESPTKWIYHIRVSGESYVIICVYTHTNFSCVRPFLRLIGSHDLNSLPMWDLCHRLSWETFCGPTKRYSDWMVS